MLNNENYKEVLNNEDKSILMISGQGCANCVSMFPIVNTFVENYPQVVLHIIEADEVYRGLVEHYGVDQIPSILLFDKGHLLAKVSGYQPYEIFEIYATDKFRL